MCSCLSSILFSIHFIFLLKMGFCIAVNCGNSSFRKQKIGDVFFFCLPEDEMLKKKWLINIRWENLLKEVRICHLHFEKSFFERYLEIHYNSLLEDEKLIKKWLINIRRENLLKGVRICHLHFKESFCKHYLEIHYNSLFYVLGFELSIK